MADRAPSGGSFLTGVRVVELADELGEYCGKLLAGLGADVIKVEPLGGEHTRLYGFAPETEPMELVDFIVTAIGAIVGIYGLATGMITI